LRARLAPAVVTPAPRSVEALVDATHGEFRHDEEGFVYFAEEPVARFAPGPSLALPEVILTDTLLGLGARARLQRRLVAYARDVAGELLAPLRALAGGAGERRGVLYALEQGLGTALPSSLEPALADLSLEDRQALEAGGVVFGRCAVFATALLDEDALATRRLLVRAAAGPRLRLPPSLGEPVLAMTPPARLAVALGYVPVARHGVRVDVLEELVDALQRDAADVRAWSRRLRCSPRIVAELLAALPSPGAAPAADC
jgi:ATP-dependent RNA helicase SUPV3L1/SUV3